MVIANNSQTPAPPHKDDLGAAASKRIKAMGSLVPYSGEPFKPGGFQWSETRQNAALSYLNEAYEGHYSGEFLIELSSADEERFANRFVDHAEEADTYGELLPLGLLDILWRIGAKPGARFYDLGSGPGKLVAMAWLAGLRATGIEFSRTRWEASCSAMVELKRVAEAQGFPLPTVAEVGQAEAGVSDFDCLFGSLQELDFRDADIVFANIASKDIAKYIASTARWLNPGSIIVSYYGLEGPEFKQIGVVSQPTTWSAEYNWIVQEVVRNPYQTGGMEPQCFKRHHEFHTDSRSCFSAPVNIGMDISDITYQSFKRWRERNGGGSNYNN